MKKMKRAKIYLITAITATVILFTTSRGVPMTKPMDVEAATQTAETIDIRIVGTTDLHGQLNSKDYELGVDYNNGGLARVFGLIQNIRNELPKENIVTLDAGDTLYDYTTEYIFSENQEVIQPIYLAMAKMGYDAITLGNHDFDYGYEYILRQLSGSGLRSVTVVSNVTDSKTGEYPFLENMLITRTVKSSMGKDVEVKIGIIGQTIPTLTSKTHSYAGILKTEDMVANAQVQATKLKDMGADIIIALSHTGIGPETPELNFKNVAYALTKIPEIDVVVCGHEHNLFPTTDMTSPYYKLPNVDKNTYLINGKNVIMAGNRGKAVGVVDLSLKVMGETLRIVDRKSEIRLVTADNTKEDQSIAKSYGSWESKLLEYSTEVIAKLAEGTAIQNYFGLLGDNEAIQLLNASKIDYGVRFANTTGKSYKNYPVIAASTYASFGAESVTDFVHIKDTITESKLSSIQPYNNYLYVYTISGKQLKEWLEWTASAYETSSLTTKWNSSTMADMMKKTGKKSLIRQEWLNDWSNFFIFDGINYEVDPSTEPRYDVSGNRISNYQRVTNIVYNGTMVEDDTQLLLVTNKITQPTAATKGVEKQSVKGGFFRTQSVLSKYIEQIAESGSIIPQLDYNWRVSFEIDTNYIVKVPSIADELFQKTPWFVEYLSEDNDYRYYLATNQESTKDTIGPHIVATPVVTSATNSPYEVAVHVTDASKINVIKYLEGEYDAESSKWFSADKLVGSNTFSVKKNGIYTIYSEDSSGNKTIYKLNINNFSDNMLGAPTVDTYTNRKTKISGRGEPNAKIIFEAYTGTYESKVKSNGTFSYELPAQPSGTTVSVYVIDEKRNLESPRVSVTVKRTGPNQPSLNQVMNTSNSISGATDDTDATVIAVIGETVYVPSGGGKELYEKNLEIYKTSQKIVEVETQIDALGYYTMILPPLDSGLKVTVYNIDHLSRNSRAVETTVLEMGPNAPIVYEISNIEKSLNGYVPANNKKTHEITVNIGDKVYTTQSDKDGKFTLTFTEQLHANQLITVTASDTKNGTKRNSFTTDTMVNDIETYVRANSTNLYFDKVSEKSYMITGYYLDTGTIHLAITKGEKDSFESNLLLIESDDYGRFIYRLDGKLEAGTTIYAMVRYSDGKILIANKTTVIPTKPEKPSLVKNINNSDKTVQVIAKKNSEVKLTIGSKSYTSKEYEFDEETGNYIYTVTIDRNVSKTAVTIIATNESGSSDPFTTTIKKAAPDQPKVNTVKAGSKKITGKIELINYISPEQSASTTEETEEIPKIFKNAPSKVAKTQTRVFAQIGKKVYEGTIDNKGNFTITIPKLSTGTKIYVWGYNKAGRGPLIKVLAQ